MQLEQVCIHSHNSLPVGYNLLCTKLSNNCISIISYSNQVSFIGLVSTKDYHKQASWVVCESGRVGVRCWKGLREEVGVIGPLGNRDSPLEYKVALNDFTDDALTVHVSSLFNGG